MIRRLYLVAICLSGLLSLQVMAQAPVIEDSDNFTILDEQQAVQELPVAKAQRGDRDIEEDVALAHDNEGGNGDAELIDRLQNLQKEVQELRGQLEVQVHDLALLRQQQLAFYKDIDARLNKSSGPLAQTTINSATNDVPNEVLALSPPSEKTVVASKNGEHSATTFISKVHNNRASDLSASARINPANEQINYLAAYDLVKTKQFDEALLAMQTFVNRYPEGGYTANAQYWLGELYMVKKNHTKAIEHFEIVLQQFPSSSKAAASLLKIGYALAASGKKVEAQKRLQDVLRNYPDTSTAQLAAIKLKTINAS